MLISTSWILATISIKMCKIVIFAEKKQINLKFTFEKRKMESKSEVLSALKPGPVILKWINALMRFDAFYAPLKA